MCQTDVFTLVHPDGHAEKQFSPNFCPLSRHGIPCANEIVFQHPPQFIAPPQYMTQLPPTPTYTPRSSTPNYRSGDDSDRSHHSSSSSKKRLSGLYIDGRKVLNVERRDRRPSRSERIVLVDSPPTPRTPPQTWNAPHTAPSSPNTNAYVVDASPRESSRRKTVIVDERPHVMFIDTPRSSKHSRKTSTSSRESRSTDDEEKRQRRKERKERKEREEKEAKEQKMRLRIAKANAEIAGRPAVPVPPAPLKRSSTSTYKRGAVEVRDREAEIAEAMNRLTFEEARREEKARKLEEKEEEAQRQRLMERIQPRRRASVGPGVRRHRVLYDDGLYRWE